MRQPWLSRRRELRTNQTSPEQKIWSNIRDRKIENAKFRRQHSIGDFIVDFYCREFSIVIEIDGNYHQFQSEKDVARDRILARMGCTILRFSNEDVDHELEAVLVQIRKTIREKKAN